MESTGGSYINYNLLPLKAYYFFYNAGSGAVVPYLATYGRQLGLSSLLVGYILCLSPLAAMVAKVFFGGVSDRFMKLRFLFLIFQVVSTVALLGIHFIPDPPRESHGEFRCNVASFFKVCKPNLGSDDSVLPKGVDTVRCRFTCDMDSVEWRNQVCNQWKLLPNCSGLKSPGEGISLSHFTFSGDLSLNHSDLENDCAYLRAMDFMTFNEEKYAPVCPSSNILKANCSAQCDNQALMDLLDVPQEHVATTSQFVCFLILTLIAWAAMEVDASLADTICFGILGAKANKYGEQRVWGAIGWGVSTLATGALIDQFSGEGEKSYSVAFYVMLINMFLSLLVSYQIKYAQTKMSRSIWLDVRKVMDCRVAMFLSCCVIMGMCTGLLWSFLYWHLEVLGEEAGSDRHRMKLLQGLTAAFQCLLGELPLFFLSGKIIKRLGHIHSITLTLIAMAIRLYLYAVLVNPWWVLPIELLQGFTFGLFYATMVSYGSMIAPPGTEATMQALVGACFGGIGVAMGSLIAGSLYMAVGGSITFAIYGTGCLLLCIGHIATHLVGKQHRYSTADSDGSKQSASYASPMDAVFITDNTET